jgi:hypothetical protein
MQPTPRFLFRGEAVGLAGHIRRPDDMVIPPQASLSLPIIGGRGASAVAGGSFGGLLKFGSAVVTVSGDYYPTDKAAASTNGKHELYKLEKRTRVSTEVLDVSIVNPDGRSGGHTLTVARLATVMESVHKWRPNAQPRFTTRLEIEGLTIDGHLFDVQFAEKLLAIETYEGLFAKPAPAGKGAGKLAGSTLRAEIADLVEPWPKKGMTAGSKGRPPEYSVCTACLSIKPSMSPQAKVIAPNRIYVKGFGTIYLAEMVLSPVDRRLALMRIELGSPVGGEILVGGSGLDGSDWPP